MSGNYLLITGGTGSFGSAVLTNVKNFGFDRVRVFSRDEKKQFDMRNSFPDLDVDYFLGDVRDYDSVYAAMKDVSCVYHAAALKQVPSCEFYPMEAMKTNAIGTSNVLDAAIACSVEKVVCLSTDKAVSPVNAMGITKALMEKIAMSKARENPATKIVVTRYGNVMGSRGSVIPFFKNQLERGLPLTITNGAMTRFMMAMDEALELVSHAFTCGEQGDIFVLNADSATVMDTAKAVAKICGVTQFNYKIIGERHGEKMHEVLCSAKEMSLAVQSDKFLRIPIDDRGVDYGKYVDVGDKKIQQFNELSSQSARRLSVDELVSKLKRFDVLSKGIY